MKTPELKEMAAMMEHSNATESVVLGMIISELSRRGCKIENLQLGIEDVNACTSEPD